MDQSRSAANPGFHPKKQEPVQKKLGFWGANTLRDVVLADLEKLDNKKD